MADANIMITGKRPHNTFLLISFTFLSLALFLFVFWVYAPDKDTVFRLRSFIFITMAFAVLFLFITRDKNLKKASHNGTLLYFFLTLKILIAGIFYYSYWYPQVEVFFDPILNPSFDSIRYEYYGNILAEIWRSAGTFLSRVEIPFAQPGYTYLAGIIYYIFGFNPFLTITLNCLAVVVTGILAFKFAFALFNDKKIAKVAMILVCISPVGYLWGSLSTKGPLVGLFLVLGSYSLFKIYTQRKIGLYIALFLVSLVLLVELRFGMALVLLLMFALSIFLFKSKLNRKVVALLLGGCILIFASYFIHPYALGGSAIIHRLSEGLLTPLGYGMKEDMIQKGWHWEEASISYALTGRLSAETLYLLPLKMAFNMIVPFPFWVYRGFGSIFSNLNTVLTILLIPCFVYGLAWSVRRNWRYYLIIYSSFFIGLAAISFAHIGVDSRYVFPLLPFFYILASVGIKYFKSYKRLYYAYLFYFIPVLGISYYAVKMIIRSL